MKQEFPSMPRRSLLVVLVAALFTLTACSPEKPRPVAPRPVSTPMVSKQDDKPFVGARESVRRAAEKEFLIGDPRDQKFHRISCRWAKRVTVQHQVLFRSLREAQLKGYRSCHACKSGLHR